MNELFEKLDIDSDSIESIMRIANTLNMADIERIRIVDDPKDKIIEVVTNGVYFYFILSHYSYVEMVRRDSLEGKIVYMPLDD